MKHFVLPRLMFPRVSLGYSYSKGFVSRLGKAPFEPPVKATLKDSDIDHG
jgi:hypothetical protein